MEDRIALEIDGPTPVYLVGHRPPGPLWGSPSAQVHPDSGYQLGGRKGLYDVVAGSRLQGPDDHCIPAAPGQDDDRQVGDVEGALHQCV